MDAWLEYFLTEFGIESGSPLTVNHLFLMFFIVMMLGFVVNLILGLSRFFAGFTKW